MLKNVTSPQGFSHFFWFANDTISCTSLSCAVFLKCALLGMLQVNWDNRNEPFTDETPDWGTYQGVEAQSAVWGQSSVSWVRVVFCFCKLSWELMACPFFFFFQTRQAQVTCLKSPLCKMLKLNHMEYSCIRLTLFTMHLHILKNRHAKLHKPHWKFQYFLFMLLWTNLSAARGDWQMKEILKQ